MDIGAQLAEAAQRLSVMCDAAIPVLEKKTIVAHATNPLNYAWPHHEQYLLKWGNRGGHTLLLGMNPGPGGMAQTGVPFGATGVAQSFLQIEARKLETPSNAHPKRPIEGMALERQEVSGTRLWNLMQTHFGTVEETFDNIFIVNHCPLLLLGETGKNLTPNNLPAAIMAPVLKACDEHLLDVIDIMGVTRVIGIGKYAEQRARMALGAEKSGPGTSRDGRSIRIDTCWHPSPASPLANRNDGADWRMNVITCLQN
jgi:single-strand selective monofunctional uracil DNA glycosylase